jgi:hypothetical protein
LIEMKYIQYNTQVNECGGSNIADRISPPANTLLLVAMAVKKDLMKNKNGKVVSKKRSALAKENHWHEEEECENEEDWINAVKKARANLKIEKKATSEKTIEDFDQKLRKIGIPIDPEDRYLTNQSKRVQAHCAVVAAHTFMTQAEHHGLATAKYLKVKVLVQAYIMVIDKRLYDDFFD